MEVESSFHIKFRLQGKSFSSNQDLIDFSRTISAEVHSFLKDWFHKRSIIEVKTSGSTGTPKVIQLQKKHMINSAKATGDFFKLSENTTALLCMSPNYIAGKMILVRALTLGWQLDVVEPTSKPLKNSNKNYDFSAMVPLQVANSLSEIERIKKLIVGGGVVSNQLLNQIKQVKTEVFATYGMTETITHIAVKKINNFSTVISSAVDKSHYKTLKNIKISTDERGCLVINAPKISDEIVVTNDLVELVSENEFKWLGRYDSIINSGGIKLIPEQIEEKLSVLIKEQFFVTGLPDAVLGEKLILVIEHENFTVERLKSLLFQKMKALKTLSKYEIPKEIYCIKNFIKTETGKINRTTTMKLLQK
ncbi:MULTISPECIES: AMP-binding protein [Flavobacteriaceae]|uniref:O-succinylbenzoic acid--CoA ligase n=2 Tax=Flavobacteriaceae TaxID=49546 RepID=A0A4Y8ANU2_9FLAO|nr:MULTISPECIES: AMP-binding protein [Flavobacteriaceae]TEW72099.1 O-succinylbenzoic acid--CoA ligase [Gramella jeungdoensis]GGK56380.1 O-succinylbenzoic acid--CoA ligase [Lutibacter litoralis]